MKRTFKNEMFAVTFTNNNTGSADSIFFGRNEKREAKRCALQQAEDRNYHEVIIEQLFSNKEDYFKIEKVK